jgi:3-polyprenyl-4-hydroxybenzoate decarboxylase
VRSQNEYVRCSLDLSRNLDNFLRELLRDEGPFGDHTGPREVRSVSASQFLLGFSFRIRHSPRPAAIVGIPPMEDFYIGGASVKLFLPIFKIHRVLRGKLSRDR